MSDIPEKVPAGLALSVSMEEPQQPAWKGGSKSGSRHTKLAYSKESIRKLEKIGFDPLLEMVSLYRRVRSQIDRQELLQEAQDIARENKLEGQVKNGYSSMALEGFMNTASKVLSDMIPYRYAKVPVEEAEKDGAPPPLIIETTKEGEMFIIDPLNESTYAQEEDFRNGD
jgi:hypothetical protein